MPKVRIECCKGKAKLKFCRQRQNGRRKKLHRFGMNTIAETNNFLKTIINQTKGLLTTFFDA
jgi:hypothetical protein